MVLLAVVATNGSGCEFATVEAWSLDVSHLSIIASCLSQSEELCSG